MKKASILLFILSISLMSFGQSEGIKSLNRKCKMVQKYLEGKYNRTITSHDCDIAIKYGNSLEATMSFTDNPDCISKVIAHFNNKNYKEIVQVTEQMEYEENIFLKTKKLKALASSMLNGYSDIEIEYTRFELSIELKGDMTKSAKENLEKFLDEFTKKENKDLLMEQMTSTTEEIRIPQFYLHITSANLDTTGFKLQPLEESTYLQSIFQIEKKFGSKADLLVEYDIAVDSRHVMEENGMKYIQRRISAVNPEDGYSISIGGYNYMNEL